jgi:hypothetical protein
MTTNPFLDENGEKVVHFAADIRTLGKLGELSSKIIEMAESGAWRRYRTAVGVDQWRECEFDYFLISCDLAYQDVYRAIAHHRAGDAVRGMMDPDADPTKRRPLEKAGAAWHAPVTETLVERAARLGWTRKDVGGKNGKPIEMRVPPLSDRQRIKQQDGITREERERKRRVQQIPARRRRELDALARETVARFNDSQEVRYFIDQITKAS